MRKPDEISDIVRLSLQDSQIEWLRAQKTALNMTYERFLEGVLSEWLARHYEALRTPQNYGALMRAALDEFIRRHAKEFLAIP